LGLLKLAEEHPSIAHVRGRGLFIGFDLVTMNDGKKELWSSAKCKELFATMLRRGLIGMAYAPRVRINPPLIFKESEVAEALEIIDASLTDVGA
jgi:4-aminobutyrate aminotransferase-like enzyme